MAINAVDELNFDLLTRRVLAAVFEVSNTLGSGFLEKVYENAPCLRRGRLWRKSCEILASR